MGTKLYHTLIAIDLGSCGSPDAHITFDGEEIHNGLVETDTLILIDQDLEFGQHTLVVEHRNKLPTDPSTELIIKSITFNNITSPKFVWQGIYIPSYPEPWATEQRNAGRILEPELAVTNHMGWNGKWVLTFTAPIFTWIHQVEDLGWIHQ